MANNIIDNDKVARDYILGEKADSYNEKESFNKNLLIEAGAGAGKTSILVSRIIEQIIREGIDLSKIVAITFTEEAAADLKNKFNEELRKCLFEDKFSYGKDDFGNDNILCDFKKNHKARENIEKAVKDIDKINISTIHSFCNTMLSEMPFEAGLGLDRDIVEGDEEEKLKKKMFLQSLGKVSDKLYKFGIRSIGELSDTFNEMIVLDGVDTWKHKNIDTKYDPEVKGKEIKGELQKLFSSLKNNVKYVCDEFAKQFPNHEIVDQSEKDDTKNVNGNGKNAKKAKKKIKYSWAYTEELFNKIFNLSDEYEEYIKGNIDIDKLKDLFILNKKYEGNKGNGNSGKNKKTLNIKLDYAPAHELENALFKHYAHKPVLKEEGYIGGYAFDVIYDDFYEIYKLYKEYMQNKHACIVETLAGAYKKYADLKEKQRVLTNDDILKMTLKMLEEKNSEALMFFANKYKYYYIDEFQDTDPIQTKIIDLLRKQSQDTYVSNIGDPKQSIYRFRGADVATYLSTMKKFEDDTKNSKICKLSRNFRSNEEIINFVNEAFKMDDDEKVKFGFPTKNDDKNKQAVYQEMNTSKKVDSVNELAGVYRYDILNPFNDENKSNYEDDESYEKKRVKVLRDAKAIAMIIADMKKKIKIKDGKKDRSLEDKDFLIITKATGNQDVYVNELKKSGINVSLSGKIPLDKDQIYNIYYLFEFLANNSRLNVANILSNTFNIDLVKNDRINYENIINMLVYNLECEEKEKAKDNKNDKSKAKEKKKAIVNNCGKSKELYDKLEKLSKYLFISKRITTFEMIDYIIKDLPNFLSKETLFDKQSFDSEIAYIIHLLEKMKEQNLATYKDMARFVLDNIEGFDDRELNLHSDENAVRIMNLHKTKGLQGKVVILANPFDTHRNMSSAHVIRDSEKKEVAYVRPFKNLENFPNPKNLANFEDDGVKDQIESQKLAELESDEYARLLYVAATRAENVLLISGKTEKKFKEETDKKTNKKIKTETIESKSCYWTPLLDAYDKIINKIEINKNTDIKNILLETEKKINVENLKDSDSKNAMKNTSKITVDKIISDNEKVIKSVGEPTLVLKNPSKEHDADRGFADKEDKIKSVEKIKNLPVEEVGNLKPYERDKGPLFGSITHRTFELLVNKVRTNAKLNDSDLSSIINHAITDTIVNNPQGSFDVSDAEAIEGFKEHNEKQLKIIVSNFMKSDLMKKIIAAKNVFTELHFEYKIKDKKQTCLINGIMDLVLENKDGSYEIWDYKTNKDVGESELNNMYRPQLNAYHEALTNIVGKKKISEQLYHIVRN